MTMAFSGSRFSKPIKICILTGVAGLFATCGFWYMRAIRTPEGVDLQKIDKERQAKDLESDPNPVHLDAMQAPNSVRDHLFDGNFKIVYRMRDMPQSCLNSLNSSFVGNSKAISKSGDVPFADPGQPAQYGDSLIPDAPFRQLVFAGQGPRTCFVYFQHGGVDHPSYCLAVFDNANRKPIWVGEARVKVRSLRDLQSLLSRNQFYDKSGTQC
jgi:hypothetical protein